MKKLIAMLLAICLLLGVLTACGEKKEADAPETTPESAPESAPETSGEKQILNNQRMEPAGGGTDGYNSLNIKEDDNAIFNSHNII